MVDHVVSARILVVLVELKHDFCRRCYLYLQSFCTLLDVAHPPRDATIVAGLANVCLGDEMSVWLMEIKLSLGLNIGSPFGGSKLQTKINQPLNRIAAFGQPLTQRYTSDKGFLVESFCAVVAA